MWLLPIIGVLIHSTVAPPPDAFPVYWNIPTATCNKAHISVPLKKFQITYNAGEEFLGDKVVIFYERKFGRCPYYNNSDPNQPINGGLPQNQSLAEHLAEVEKQIMKEIPDENFNGIAVIDVEEFRPLYSMNWGDKDVYKRQSRNLIQAEYRYLKPEQIEERAEIEYNKAARRFFVETIKTARKLRPKAKWGYYDYPFCNYNSIDPNGDFECSEEAKSFNDRMSFIWNATSVLFPSIYLNGRKSATQNFRFIQALLRETKRVAGTQKRRVDYYAYSKFEYDPYTDHKSFYGKEDLCNTIKQAADLGSSGLVLWSTSKKLRERCSLIADFMTEHLGPYIMNVREQFNKCRREKCSGNGNCVLNKPLQGCFTVMKPELYPLYVCYCDRGFEGKHCSKKVATKQNKP